MFNVSYNGGNKKVLWQELWRHEFEEAVDKNPIVVVPTGSIEQHGPHCSADVEISIPFFIGVSEAQQVDDFPDFVASPVWWGLAHYNKGFPGTISLRAETYLHLLEDVCMSIWEDGFKRMVVLNGHGENAAPNRVIRDILSEQNVFIITYRWWDSVKNTIKSGDSDSNVGDGGEWETSSQLFLREQLVSKLHIAGDVPLTSPFDPKTGQFATSAERRQDTRDRTRITGGGPCPCN